MRLVDLDGDGLTDVVRSGSSLECWFNDADPRRAWQRTAVTNGPAAGIDFADPRVRLADMTGDGLQDIVLVRSGNIAYWPNLGHGRFGAPVQMRRAPRLPDGHDPRRLLLGDVDGDGVADLVYVDHGRVLLWGNQSGNAWTAQPVTVTGTPDVVDTDAVQFADLHGTGMAGLLWSRGGDPSAPGHAAVPRPHRRRQAATCSTRWTTTSAPAPPCSYVPSTQFHLRRRAAPRHPVAHHAAVPGAGRRPGRGARRDLVRRRLTTEYRYHHGYWDGVEREFRGFGMVEQLDTETFDVANGVPAEHYSPPTLTKTWFHLGPVAAAEAGDWTELDLSHEYWPGDPPMLVPADADDRAAGGADRARRAATRCARCAGRCCAASCTPSTAPTARTGPTR